jgi:hypothetical protein
MEKREMVPDFSLLEGPLHRLGCRLGLFCGGTNTVALGLDLSAFPGIVLRALALVDGLGQVLFPESVRHFRRSDRQPTCGFESYLASFAFHPFACK